MVRAVIITAQGFQDEEYLYPYYRLKEIMCEVEVATPDGEVVYGEYGVPARASMSVKDLEADEFDVAVIPGGVAAPDKLRIMPDVVRFISEMDQSKKLIAAMCHGPWVLINAGVVKGRRVTAYWTLEADLRNAGASYQHKVPVVVDGNIITSPIYTNNPEFLREIVSYIEKKMSPGAGVVIP